MKQKAFFIIFKGLSIKQITQIFLKGESPTLKTTTQKGNVETRQMTPFFPPPFPALSVCNIHFCI